MGRYLNQTESRSELQQRIAAELRAKAAAKAPARKAAAKAPAKKAAAKPRTARAPFPKAAPRVEATDAASAS